MKIHLNLTGNVFSKLSMELHFVNKGRTYFAYELLLNDLHVGSTCVLWWSGYFICIGARSWSLTSKDLLVRYAEWILKLIIFVKDLDKAIHFLGSYAFWNYPSLPRCIWLFLIIMLSFKIIWVRKVMYKRRVHAFTQIINRRPSMWHCQ